MLIFIIILFVILGFLLFFMGFVLYSSYIDAKKAKQLRANIARKRSFVATFSPSARIIVNNGDYLFFLDDVNRVFGVDDSGATYSYSGLFSVLECAGHVSLQHEDVPAIFGMCDIGKRYSDDPSPALDDASISAIADAMLPILRNNLYQVLMDLDITPTHEYVDNGTIWGCDMNSRMFYNTRAGFNIYPFSKLLGVTTTDLGDSYWINVTINEDYGEDEITIYDNDKTPLNCLLSMFKDIQYRQKSFTVSDKQRNFDIMEGHEFEYFCADVLRKNGYENVNVTQGSGDQGIDIIAYRDAIKYGIQCKCYSSDIGNRAVQEVFAGKAYYECHIGVVLTNQFFTKSAVELAKKNGIILWDRNKLLELIDDA